MTLIEQLNSNPQLREQYIMRANAGDTSAMLLLGDAEEALGTVESYTKSIEWKGKAFKSGMIEAGYYAAKTAMTLAQHYNHSDDSDVLSGLMEENFWDRAFVYAEESHKNLPRNPENMEMITASQNIMKEAMYHLSLFAIMKGNTEKLKTGVNLFETISTSGDRERLLCAYAHFYVFKDFDDNTAIPKLAEMSRILAGSLYGNPEYVQKAEKKEQLLYARAVSVIAISMYKGFIGNDKESSKLLVRSILQVVTYQKAKDYLEYTLDTLEKGAL